MTKRCRTSSELFEVDCGMKLPEMTESLVERKESLARRTNQTDSSVGAAGDSSTADSSTDSWALSVGIDNRVD